MITTVVNGLKIEMYDGDISELPAYRFQRFNKFILLDAGIGSDIQDVDNHIERIIGFIQKDPKTALIELENMRQNLYLVMRNINPKHLAVVTLIKSINGVANDDLSDEGVKTTYERINKKIKTGWFGTIYQAIKKKIDTELSMYFPQQFDSVKIKEYYELMRKKILLQCDQIITGKYQEAEINNVYLNMVTYMKPTVFLGVDNAEVIHEKAFAEINFLIMNETGNDAKNMTVLELYSALQVIKKRNKHGRKSNQNK